MAKIKQFKKRLELNPNNQWAETTVCINYDNRTKHSPGMGFREVPTERFYISLPQVIADALGISEVRAGDQFEVEKLFMETIEKFKKLATEINRVILYRFEVDPKPNATKSKYDSGVLKVNVWAGTFEETVAIAGDGTRRYSYAKVDSEVNFSAEGADGLGPSWARREGKMYDSQVPWNRQNEAFFIWLKERMNELITKMNVLTVAGQLIEAINAGRLLPLGTTE